MRQLYWLLIAFLVLLLDTLVTMVLLGAFIGSVYYVFLLLYGWKGV